MGSEELAKWAEDFPLLVAWGVKLTTALAIFIAGWIRSPSTSWWCTRASRLGCGAKSER